MTLQQLKYLSELLYHPSISSAAQALSISQPSLSAAIKDLEKEFQIKLITRTHNGISFTTEGREFLYFAQTILRQATNLQHHFHGPVDYPLPYEVSLAYQYHPLFLTAITDVLLTSNSHPLYTLNILQKPPSEIIRAVTLEKLQVGLLYLPSPILQKRREHWIKQGLHIFILGELSPYVYLKPYHPLSIYPCLTIGQLRTFSQVSFATPPDDTLTNALKTYLFSDSKKNISVTDAAMLWRIIKNTTAFTIGPGTLYSNIAENSLQSIKLTDPNFHFTLFAVTHASYPATLEISTLFHTLKKRITIKYAYDSRDSSSEK